MSTPKHLRIYTRTGDHGQTALFNGDKVSKSHPRVVAYGTLDELNSLMGWARITTSQSDVPGLARLDEVLITLQQELFEVGADLATPPSKQADTYQIKRIGDGEVTRLENWIDELDGQLPVLREFILPGGTEAAARLHVCRTVCRRAEREAVIAVSEDAEVNPGVVTYLNRLNDLLFVMARYANFAQNRDDEKWRR